MVGNDIIDISEAKRVSDWKRTGFLEKIFSVAEQSMIHNSIDPFTTVWQLWSMKESAYKVFIQAGGERFFNPSKIECTLKCAENGEVRISGMVLKTKTLFHANYIFSTAIFGDDDVESAIFQLPESDLKRQSDFMHLQVIKAFAQKHLLNSKDLRIAKTDAGVPEIFCGNDRLDVSLSITHHGRFGGFTISGKVERLENKA